MSTNPNALPAGYRLEEYEITRSLGDGGFGITYQGRDTRLDKRVAIKEYFPEQWARRLPDGAVAPMSHRDADDFEWGLQRFLEEAQTLAKFDHPNIVRASRIIPANGTAYIVMDFVDGEPLDKILERQKTLDLPRVRRILEKLVEGLECVHELNFLHRDIKPANVIMRTGRDEPVLIDFGSARETVQNKTQALTALVSKGYAPHEQYATESDNQGPWTDLYAVAALGYRALTGAPPPEGNSRWESDAYVPLDESHSPDSRLCRAINESLRVRTRDRPRDAAAWFEIAGTETSTTIRSEIPLGTTPDRTRLRSEQDERPPAVARPPVRRPGSPRGVYAVAAAAALLIVVALLANGVDWNVSGERIAIRDDTPSRPMGGGGAAGNPAVARTGASAGRAPGARFSDACAGCPDLVVVPAGGFEMGSEPGDDGHQASEAPKHRVTVPRAFAMSATEITVGQWQACVAGGGCGGYDPAVNGAQTADPRYPVTMVSFRHAEMYAAWLSQLTRERYRLPTESEWEYAARAGSSGIFWWGDAARDGYANCRNCGAAGTGALQAVAQHQPNPFQLFDLHGNVWEWVQDCWTADYTNAPVDGSVQRVGDCSKRVIRGGSYADPLPSLRAANRHALDISQPQAATTLGFRIVRELP